jgi:hypothetical protein
MQDMVTRKRGPSSNYIRKEFSIDGMSIEDVENEIEELLSTFYKRHLNNEANNKRLNYLSSSSKKEHSRIRSKHRKVLSERIDNRNARFVIKIRRVGMSEEEIKQDKAEERRKRDEEIFGPITYDLFD